MERDRQTALLLIAHGSREAEANADLEKLAAQLKRSSPYAIVESSFLELAEPTIDRAADRCITQGANVIVLVPYFLSAGVHVQRDLNGIKRRLGERYAKVTF